MNVYLNKDGAFGKQLFQEFVAPAGVATPEQVAAYEALGKKYIHWTTANDTPGCKMLMSAWYFEPNRDAQLHGRDISEFECHVHETDEILIYYGSDPADPEHLGGEIEFLIGGESHVITKSTMLYVPAGVPHSKPLVNKIDKPIFHMAMELAR